MTHHKRLMHYVVACAVVLGCAPAADTPQDNELLELVPIDKRAEIHLKNGQYDAATSLGTDALAESKFEAAQSIFGQMVEVQATQCTGHYGLMLAEIQALLGYINVLLGPIAAGLDSPGFVATQDLVADIVENLINDAEVFFEVISGHARGVIDSDCRLSTPRGVPFSLGNEETILYFSTTWGYEWDSISARVILASIQTIQGAIDYVLAHELVFNDDAIGKVSNNVDAFQNEQRGEELATEGTPDAVRHSYVPALRKFGAIFDLVPNLLRWSNETRRARIDDEWAEALRTVYTTLNGKPEGIVPDIIRFSIQPDKDEEGAIERVADRVFGYVDNNRDGAITVGDEMLIGLRGVEITGYVSIPDNAGGIRVELPPQLKDFGTVVDEVNTMVDIVGRQLTAVDDEATATDRLTVNPFNNILVALEIDDDVRLMPAVVELDFRAFFEAQDGRQKPRAVRELLPLWHDHDGDGCTDLDRLATADGDAPCTLDEFIIEAESIVHYDDGQRADGIDLVSTADVPHFPREITFGTIADFVEGPNVTNLRIEADGLLPPGSLKQPFPYVALQSPSLNDVLWLNLHHLPAVRSDYPADAFALANHQTFNTFVIGIVGYYLNDVNLGL